MKEKLCAWPKNDISICCVPEQRRWDCTALCFPVRSYRSREPAPKARVWPRFQEQEGRDCSWSCRTVRQVSAQFLINIPKATYRRHGHWTLVSRSIGWNQWSCWWGLTQIRFSTWREWAPTTYFRTHPCTWPAGTGTSKCKSLFIYNFLLNICLQYYSVVGAQFFRLHYVRRLGRTSPSNFVWNKGHNFTYIFKSTGLVEHVFLQGGPKWTKGF